jgi:predicted GIY-YIG superfamily endonuclease
MERFMWASPTISFAVSQSIRAPRFPGSRSAYGVNRLVYFETCDNPEGAILREKYIKNWYRRWKIELIEKHNPDWHDLAPGLVA